MIPPKPDPENLENLDLKDLFKLAQKIGGRRYHKLTADHFADYRQFDYWRYINGDSECGSTPESKEWVRDNSDQACPICDRPYTYENGRTIDHKLPRSQYPWLSLDFQNLWVICRACNQEKGEMHWFEYEHYIFVNYPHFYEAVRIYRPKKLLKTLDKST
ncbi:MAG: HNH endonuclease [Limnospira sp. PMC 1291.21]|uniref:HNH endonuclease n=1 Tax=Limnospira fusiformis PMC 851.14 TaxID=2219512 RepID=A0ABU9EIB8_LIMFS|nr:MULTISPECIES: HNH endonuclease [Limnospira]EKD07447.1 hypothetical protein SPLC1_S411140 [Arthrospira platensis C1]MDY7052221.1 HNH endonuclease [Limnospira fusiformis LS22]QJB25776.1 HNH endonuclease [Limnospira fusiformis SAG 85.79]MDT9176054.1 HNH endonuclease [Limnospira sp. PMC 1238.20]MDT9186387.1 HNH endonuclease [Limnospira sp. PMC 894.15]